MYSWFPKQGQNLSEVFPGFLRRWQDDTWNQSIRLAIHWYLESNAQAGAIPGSIILLQTALELLAWVFLVEEVGISAKKLSDKSDKKYGSTSNKINRLFEKLGIPKEIPPNLSRLTKFESTLQYSKNNGAYALTEVRNSIVHAAPENRAKYRDIPFETQIEAFELSLWYLELILLRLFDYQGAYFNRVAERQGKHYKDNIEAVPWS